MEKVQELKGLILELVDKSKVREEKEKAQEDRIKALEEMTSEQKAMIEKLEREPVKSKIIVPGTDQMVDVIYRGYNLADQGLTVQIADPEKKERYAKFLIDFVTGKAAMNEGTAAEGGYLVPDEFHNEIMAFARLTSFALNDCRVFNMTRDTIKIPAENAHVSVSWTGEATTLSESEPTFAEVQLTPKKLGAFSIASQELLDDSAFDIVSYLTADYAEAIGQEIDNRVLNAGSNSTFTGALTGAGSTVTQVATGGWNGFAPIDLSTCIGTLPPNKIVGAKFIFHRLGFMYIRALKDTNGAPIFAMPGNGVPGTIYEYPYALSEKMPYTNSTGNYIGLFGNLKYYGLGVRRASMALAMDPYGLFTKDQVRFKMTVRVQGKPLLASGLVAIKGKS